MGAVESMIIACLQYQSFLAKHKLMSSWCNVLNGKTPLLGHLKLSTNLCQPHFSNPVKMQEPDKVDIETKFC